MKETNFYSIGEYIYHKTYGQWGWGCIILTREFDCLKRETSKKYLVDWQYGIKTWCSDEEISPEQQKNVDKLKKIHKIRV